MNYRELLKKYIEFIGESDGVDYLNCYSDRPHYISIEEWKELLALSSEPLLEDEAMEVA